MGLAHALVSAEDARDQRVLGRTAVSALAIAVFSRDAISKVQPRLGDEEQTPFVAKHGSPLCQIKMAAPSAQHHCEQSCCIFKRLDRNPAPPSCVISAYFCAKSYTQGAGRRSAAASSSLACRWNSSASSMSSPRAGLFHDSPFASRRQVSALSRKYIASIEHPRYVYGHSSRG